ncbi:DUF4097 family beta strand repeat-containing protein [Pendulispora albinea]|uniref:Adhesin domain-containing protein n=1 Tax=Pendulispora albinea TaxID=2741071 RepID=A0ABZ2M3L6_9BACT
MKPPLCRHEPVAFVISILSVGAALGCASSGSPPPPASASASAASPAAPAGPSSPLPAPGARSEMPESATYETTGAARTEGGVEPEFRYEKALAAPKKLEIYGFNGAVRVTGGTSQTVAVRASKRVLRGNPASQRIVVAEHPGGVVICVLLQGEPDGSCRPHRDPLDSHEHGPRPHGPDDEIEIAFEARVPQGVGFVGVTMNGKVEARGLRADSELVTMNGAITAETEGRIAAKTMNGAIVARALAKTTAPVNLETMNGSIDLTVLPNANFQLAASTMSGRITTDFPVTTRSSSFGPESLTATVGRGGVPIALRAMNGSIAVHQAR